MFQLLSCGGSYFQVLRIRMRFGKVLALGNIFHQMVVKVSAYLQISPYSLGTLIDGFVTLRVKYYVDRCTFDFCENS